MKSLFFLFLFCSAVVFSSAQEAKPKASPLVSTTKTIKTGAAITISYGQPSVKGRVIGKDLEPMQDKVWRTGANEATVFEVSKAVKIEGKELPAGKYGLFTLAGEKDWTIIFNKTWKQWGAYDYKESDDALRITAKVDQAKPFAEKLTFNIDESGKVSLLWGDSEVKFKVE